VGAFIFVLFFALSQSYAWWLLQTTPQGDSKRRRAESGKLEGGKVRDKSSTDESQTVDLEGEVNEELDAEAEVSRKDSMVASLLGLKDTPCVRGIHSLQVALKDKIKIMVSYCQVVLMFKMNLAIPWPEEMLAFFSVFSVFNFDLLDFVSLGCLSDLSYFDKFYMVMSAPLVYSVFIQISKSIGTRTFIEKDTAMYTRWSARHSQISTIGLFLLYPQLSSTVLKSFNCKTVEGRSWLVADMSIDCLSPEYITHWWVSLFFLFLYPIGIPAFLAWKLEQKKHILFSHFAVSDLGFQDKFSTDECGDMYRIYGMMKMNVVQVSGPTVLPNKLYTVCAFTDASERIKLRCVHLDDVVEYRNDYNCEHVMKVQIAFAWLASAYEPELCHWELLEFLRKFCFGSLIVFVKPGSGVQILISLMICVAFLCLVGYLKPYSEEEDDYTNMISFLSLTLTLIMGLALKMGSASASEGDEDTRVVFVGLLILTNVLLIIISAWQTCTSLRKQVDEAKALEKYYEDEDEDKDDHLSGAVSLSASKLLQELDAVDAESADGGRNPLVNITESPDAPGIELSALSEPREPSADEVAQFVSTEAKHSRNLQCLVDA
jgi:hypothetical protein